jgi:hypothetical protein
MGGPGPAIAPVGLQPCIDAQLQIGRESHELFGPGHGGECLIVLYAGQAILIGSFILTKK